MRILLSCLQSLKKHSLPAYGFWRNYFVEGLHEAGHEVIEVPNVDWTEGVTYSRGGELEAWRSRTWETVGAFVRQELARRPVHLFLSYFYPQQVEVDAIRELQQRGIPCVNFFCDNVREFDHVPAEFRPFALHWVPEFEAQSMYREAGLPYLHAPMPCWISAELRQLPCVENEPPTFIGSADVLRRDLLSRALQQGADFVIRGNGWLADKKNADGAPQARSVVSLVKNQIDLVRRRGWVSLLRKLENHMLPLRPAPIRESQLGETLSDTDYIRVMRGAIVSIGINRVPTANRSLRQPLVYSRLRDIEAPMLGACYLTEWTAGLEHMYEVGEEIETYRTPEELTSKLADLCLDSVRRRALRRRAQRRALADHSVTRSIARISAHFGL